MYSCVREVSRWFTPSACDPGSPELSKSDSDMARKLFTFTFTFTFTWNPCIRAGQHIQQNCAGRDVCDGHGKQLP